MRRIVVGYDGSGCAEVALRWAVEEARRRHLAVEVVTVHDDLPVGMPPRRQPEPSPDAERVAAEIANGLLHDVTREHGTPSERLVAACTADDLLVLGSHGHGPLAGALMGSVSRACLHAAPCPVVVVREQAAADGPVVVGLDASPPSRRALAFAAEAARLRDVPLVAVHAVGWNPVGAELMTPTSDELAEWGEQLVAAELERAQVTARSVIDPGHASDALVRASEHAGLLVVGSRGRNPLVSLLLGSTGDHCAGKAGCPVVVVR